MYDCLGRILYEPKSQQSVKPHADSNLRELRNTVKRLRMSNSRLQKRFNECLIRPSREIMEKRLGEVFGESTLFKEFILSQYRRYSNPKVRRQSYTNIENEIATILFNATRPNGYE